MSCIKDICFSNHLDFFKEYFMKKMIFILGLLAFASCGTRSVADRDDYDDNRHDRYHDDNRRDHDRDRDDRDDDRRWWW